MESIGLTHGGFYNHFGSKEALVAETIEQSLERFRQQFDANVRAAPAGKPALEVLVDFYLTNLHRDSVATGCPLPALGAEVARGPKSARAALTAKVKEIVGLFDKFARAEGWSDPEPTVIALLAAGVGGILLARAVNDDAYSDAIIRSCRDFLKAVLTRPS